MNLFQAKHELWLQLLFGSFCVEDHEIKERLYESSMIAFRHLKWIAQEHYKNNVYYNYRRENINIQFKDIFSLLAALKGRLQGIETLYTDTALSARMRSDDLYLISRISSWQQNLANNAPISAFDKHMRYEDKALNVSQRDALIRFLFEESYKEYELIMVYFYMQIHTDKLAHVNVFTDLIDESHYHLKCFGTMLSKMGLLALPREVHELSYKVENLDTFIQNSIDEEFNAKEECRRLSEAVEDKELKAFFDFINDQESYHIELMKCLL
jgi:rubrerythrin